MNINRDAGQNMMHASIHIILVTKVIPLVLEVG